MGNSSFESSEAQVFDFHVHYVRKEFLNPTWLNYLKDINPSFYAQIEEFGRDPEKYILYLRSQGVKYAVILPECAPATSGNVPTEEVIEFCREKEMLIPFASINPNLDSSMVSHLEEYVRMGVKGLKLHPSYQFFYPNEPRLYPLYQKAQELGIPVVFHIGSSIFEGTRLKYCDPIYLDDVAVDFPNLKIVMAHSGRGFWYEKCFFLSRLHRNVYMDITGLPPKNLLKYFPEIERNAHKVIFGSDWPTIPRDIGENVKDILALPLSREAKELILFGNAYRILFET